MSKYTFYRNNRIKLFVFCLIIYTSSYAQVKFEKEYRIKEDQVPSQAVTFIKKAFNEVKIKWYKEESHEGKTIEAKTVVDGIKHSIEFDTLGTPLDVERTVKLSSLSSTLQEDIKTTLEQQFVKYKIIKIQTQWKAADETLIQLLRKEKTTHPYAQNYEIVLKGMVERSYQRFEVLLNEKAELLKILTIQQRNTDNLDF
ncbi:hypothetical protein [Aquimarina spongiae]|uniref:Uncharacterized protein n=1 Tax=Aquimarina spongiae TaxID=570521 RepID=A0A1M6CMP8_9FLAO|nr:hypothetical protein [Aquimarina spongiae]SHI61978.1 hypothetical protein SAMN04488508_102178 [Aquimarina spongiae]